MEINGVVQSSTAKQPTEQELKTKARKNGSYYVAGGETLCNVAKKFKMTVENFKKLTGLKSDSLNKGQIISNIPCTTISQGQGLRSLAKKNGMTFEDFLALNGITETYTPQVGETFYIFKPNDTVPKTQDAAAKSTNDSQMIVPDAVIDVPEGYHLVNSNDTLYGIARHYGKTISEILDMNSEIKYDKNGNPIIEPGNFIKVEELTEKNNVEEESQQVFGKWKIENGKGAYSIMTKFNLFKEELAKLNPDVNLDKINIGEVFKVPGYRVKNGDTYEQIAKSHYISVDALKKLNPELKDLTSGTIINVPKIAGQDLGLGDLEIEYDVEVDTPQRITHTIQSGDVLSLIAEKYHVPMWAIMLHNGIQHQDKIQAGKVLEIPFEDEIAELEKLRQEMDKKEEVDKETTYTIKNGDTLSAIALKYGISETAIATKNNINNPSMIKAGNEIIIPSKKEAEELRQKASELRTKQAQKAAKIQSTQTTTKTTATKQDKKADKISQKHGIQIEKVDKGETIKSIAKKYNLPEKDIIAYNSCLKNIALTDDLSEKNIKTINIVATKKAVTDATGVSQKFIDDLIDIEKIHYKLYNDTCNVPTIGIGHNTSAHHDTALYRGKTLSDNEVYSLLARDIIEAQESIKKSIGKDAFDNLSRGQKEALYGLIFNIGSLENSPKLKEALKNGDYVTAVCQINHVMGTVNGQSKVIPGLAKRRFMDIAKFVEDSNFNKAQLREVTASIQSIYERGFASIKCENTKVDYNAYAHKFLGNYIDDGMIILKE